jgi:hemerythrin-like domain-containing protein
MKSRGLLMIEHRLIEKMLLLAENEVNKMNVDNFNPILVDSVVDFIKIYADRTHHGKEEDILFKKLELKALNQVDRKIMEELIDEHKQARNKVGEIIRLNSEYKKGQKNVVTKIIEIINWLNKFYPVHIKKEDEVFFPKADTYFSNEELEQMLKDYYEFDAKMIHEKYNKLYEELSK